MFAPNRPGSLPLDSGPACSAFLMRQCVVPLPGRQRWVSRRCRQCFGGRTIQAGRAPEQIQRAVQRAVLVLNDLCLLWVPQTLGSHPIRRLPDSIIQTDISPLDTRKNSAPAISIFLRPFKGLELFTISDIPHSFGMHTSWIPLVLTVCQALLADALPAPPFSQLQKREDPDCPEYGGRGPFDERLTVPFVHTRLTSAPTSSPSDLDTPAPSLFASADFQSGPHASPILNTSPAAASASSSLSGDSSPDPTPGSPRTFGGEFAESQASRYESVIVFGDPHLNLQTVISTDLPSVQSPTFTSAAQSFPDTTGVGHCTIQTNLH